MDHIAGQHLKEKDDAAYRSKVDAGSGPVGDLASCGSSIEREQRVDVCGARGWLHSLQEFELAFADKHQCRHRAVGGTKDRDLTPPNQSAKARIRGLFALFPYGLNYGEYVEQNNDRNGNVDQPQQYACRQILRSCGLARDEQESRSRAATPCGRFPISC
jgi:hypothetical protein